jgi:hypothetical protein
MGPEAEPATAAAPPGPTTIEAAQADLERARTELEGVGAPLAPAGSTSTTDASATGAAPPAPPAAKQEAPCAKACRAMSSMRRAVDAICRLAGESEQRCMDARATLKTSEARVAGCGC